LLSRVAACLVQGTAERAGVPEIGVPEIDLSRPDRKASATPLSSKFATQSVSEPQQPRPFASCRWNLGTTYRRQALFVCEGLPASPPIPRQGTLVTSRMEVRSALGPAITRAGGIKSNEGRRPIMKIPFRVLVWPNPLIETIKSRAFISANFRHGPVVFARDRGGESGLGGLAVEPLRIKAVVGF
jgi:hypothetical protein